jgi:predicted ATP-grasp superfamily ATP-dependent carboligase
LKPSVLVAGFSTRHVARSAFYAGYDVYAVDHFCDKDLAWYTKECIGFEDLDELPEAVHRMQGRHKVGHLVVTSGAEMLDTGLPVLGTSREVATLFLDKMETQVFLEDLGVPVPPLAWGGEFPVMLKPRIGSGGWRNLVARTPEEKRRWEETWADIPSIAQRVVPGIPASVCCVADGKHARAIAVNEQILRGGEESAYGFCGSVTPFDHPCTIAMVNIAEKVAGASGCVGTIGIDFMADDEAWVIEINPRFQGTLDTVEIATGCNLFSLHTAACEGRLPPCMPGAVRYAIREILFAERDTRISADISIFSPAVSDIPWPGSCVEKGHAIVSVYGWGLTRDAAMVALRTNITAVRSYVG